MFTIALATASSCSFLPGPHLTNILRRSGEKDKCEFMEKLVIFEVKETFRTASAYKIDDGNIKSSEFNCSPFLISFTE